MHVQDIYVPTVCFIPFRQQRGEVSVGNKGSVILEGIGKVKSFKC